MNRALQTTQDIIHQALAVHEAGGHLIVPEFPERRQFHLEALQAENVRKTYAPGCGELTRVEGTSGGEMPCGANLTRFGRTAPYFCQKCEQKMMTV